MVQHHHLATKMAKYADELQIDTHSFLSWCSTGLRQNCPSEELLPFSASRSSVAAEDQQDKGQPTLALFVAKQFGAAHALPHYWTVLTFGAFRTIRVDKEVGP